MNAPFMCGEFPLHSPFSFPFLSFHLPPSLPFISLHSLSLSNVPCMSDSFLLHFSFISLSFPFHFSSFPFQISHACPIHVLYMSPSIPVQFTHCSSFPFMSLYFILPKFPLKSNSFSLHFLFISSSFPVNFPCTSPSCPLRFQFISLSYPLHALFISHKL